MRKMTFAAALLTLLSGGTALASGGGLPKATSILPTMNIITQIWVTLSNANSKLQLFAFLLFVCLIPFFSVVSVLGIRKSVTMRRDALLKTFPRLKDTIYYTSYIRGPRNIDVVKFSRYLLPIVFIFLINVFMSMILLDFSQVTNEAIVKTARVFILCGGHCNEGDEVRKAYQAATFVAAAYAFLGWMAWTFVTIFDRAGALQLFPSTFNRLLIRLVVALLVAIVARHLLGDNISVPTLSFVIGMFPERGIAYIVSKFEDWTRSTQRSEDFDMELIEGVSPSLKYRLEEIGIDSGASLAHANPFVIFDASLTRMSEIIDWIAQAQLLLYVKHDRFQTLQKAGYRNIFDLIRLLISSNGQDTLRTLCNWVVDPPVLIESVQAECDYKHLVEVYTAIGSVAPDSPAVPAAVSERLCEKGRVGRAQESRGPRPGARQNRDFAVLP